MTIPNKTLTKFRKYVKSVGGQTKAARLLGCSKSMVCLMSKGERRPKFRTLLAQRVALACDIEELAWYPLTIAGKGEEA